MDLVLRELSNGFARKHPHIDDPNAFIDTRYRPYRARGSSLGKLELTMNTDRDCLYIRGPRKALV